MAKPDLWKAYSLELTRTAPLLRSTAPPLSGQMTRALTEDQRRSGLWRAPVASNLTDALRCVIHTMRSADLIRELKEAGWVLKRV